MGGIYERIPLTYTSMLIGSLALMGLPFFSGYFFKDLILEFIYLADSDFKIFAFVRYFWSLSNSSFTRQDY